MRGRSIALSRPRRAIGDLVALAEASTKSVISRRMRLARLVAAMEAARERPPFSAVLVRAFALVSAADPQLRRAYVRLPWPQLYEYPKSAALIAVEREYGAQSALFFARLTAPEDMALAEIAAAIRHVKSAPVESVGEFRRMLRIARLPLPVRRLLWWLGLNVGRQRAKFFGTFGLSTVAGAGATIDVTFNPSTFTLTCGPLGAAGEIDMILNFDHRVIDGAAIARTLEALEAALLGPVLAEVEEGGRRALHIVAARP